VDHLITFGGSTFKWCYFSDAQSLAEQAAEMGDGKKKKK